MSITPESKLIEQGLKEVALKMMIAARTAPKGRGINTLEMLLAEGKAILELADIKLGNSVLKLDPVF